MIEISIIYRMQIETIPSSSKKHIYPAWKIKQDIKEEYQLLKQNWSSFKHVYRNSKIYIMKSVEGILIGFACIMDNNYLSLLAVHVDHQRTGIGRNLIETIKEDYNYIYCHTRVTNKDACEFYKSVGLEKITIEENYYQCGEDAYELEYVNEDAIYTV